MAGGSGSKPDGFGCEDATVSARFQTPWGEGVVTVCGGRLTGVELPPALEVESVRVCGAAVEADRVLLGKWVKELEAYFVGERLSWSAEEIDLRGRAMTAFTRAVYEALLSVPAGVTVSYGALAAMAGFPGAARAVGTAMANNCIPIVVPCHRVVRSDGSLGRYGSDPSWKERLLAHERLHVEEGFA